MPRLLLVYHFFQPDPVVSARLYADFAEEQRRRGWEVTVLTSNRAWGDLSTALPARESWRGVDVRRLFRPPWSQSRPLQRLANSAWLLGGWSLDAIRHATYDAVVIGSDPAFAALLALPLRLRFPRAAIVHWCYDLYPEAIVAEGAGRVARALVPVARAVMKRAYRACDALVDLGPCMRRRLEAYDVPAVRETIVPWALVEPAAPAAPDPAVRRELFGEARLGLLYSGTLGRAHDFETFLTLARACRQRWGNAVAVTFACRGNRFAELERAVTPADTNVRFAEFAAQEDLQKRLEAADLHLLSLRGEWTGIVVPSKFFGSLAVGRPVVFAGPSDSSIPRWIRELDVGVHLDGRDLAPVLHRLAALQEKPDGVRRWQENAFRAYRQTFAKSVSNERWDHLLRELASVPQQAGPRQGTQAPSDRDLVPSP